MSRIFVPSRAGLWMRMCLALALMASIPGSLRAEPPEPADATRQDPEAEEKESLEKPPEAEITERVVVTANRLDTEPERVGSTVTVITEEELDRRQVRLGADALRTVPGVDVLRSGGAGNNTSIFLRGSDSDHTMVLLDGIELNDPSTPSRTPFIDHLTTDSLERIEVLRGPQSTLYGSDGMGGVVQFITRRGSGKPRASFWTEGGSFSTFRGGFSSSGGHERLNHFVSVSHADSEGFSATSTGTERDPYRNTAFAGRLGLGLGRDRELDIVVHHVDAKVDFDGFGVEEGHFIDAQQSVVKIEPRFQMAGGRWSHKLGVRLARHERDTKGSFPSLVRGRLFALDWQNNLKLAEAHTLTFGVDSEWERAEFPILDDSSRTLGLYVQDQFLSGRNLFGTIGMRMDDHSRFGREATFRIAGGYRIPKSRLTLRTSYGTGFKAPSLSELNPLAFGGNPDLEPETTWGFDLGLEHKSESERLAVGATYFESHTEDLIIAVFNPASGSFRNLNVDEADARGLEFHLGLSHAAPVRFAGSYTYTHTEANGSPQGFGLQEGSSLLRRPRHKGRIDVDYGFFQDRANLAVGVSYVGKRDDVDPVSFSVARADDYLLVNLAVGVDVGRGLKLFGRIDNLLDEEYEEILGFKASDLSGYAGVRFRF